MRKVVLIVCCLAVSSQVFSQVKIGLQFSPILSTNRVEAESQDFDIDSDGTGLRLALGPIVDIQLTDNYFFSTGLLYASKRAGFERIERSSGISVKEEYSLQYLQIPATMKLFTNEVSLDKRLFFQVGGNFEFNIDEKVESETSDLVEDFLFFDLSLLAAVGMEYQLGTSTIAFASISYHRGLINAVGAHNDLYGNVNLKNDGIGLNLGIKF